MLLIGRYVPNQAHRILRIVEVLRHSAVSFCFPWLTNGENKICINEYCFMRKTKKNNVRQKSHLQIQVIRTTILLNFITLKHIIGSFSKQEDL
jgi:hypothetical protein